MRYCEVVVRVVVGGFGAIMLIAALAYMLMGVDIVYGPWRDRR